RPPRQHADQGATPHYFVTANLSTRDNTESSHEARKVWVTWESADGPRNTAGKLISLNDRGFLALTVDDHNSLWIALPRIYSVSTSLGAGADSLTESTAAVADAVIQAAAENAPEAPTGHDT